MTKINKTLFVFILVATFLYCISLAFQVPIFQQIPDWYWHFNIKTLDFNITVATFSVLISLFIFLFYKNYFKKFHLILLIFLGIFIQLFFGSFEGSNFSGIKNRMRYSFHSEFVNFQIRNEISPKTFIEYYDRIVKNNRLVFHSTKPPGNALLYYFTKRVATFFYDILEFQKLKDYNITKKYRRFIQFSFIIFLPMCYLILFLLNIFYKSFLSSNENLPIFLFLFLPSITLMNLYPNQFLFPSLFLFGILLNMRVYKSENHIWSLCSGIYIFLILFINFSFLSLIPFLLIFLIINRFRKSHEISFKIVIESAILQVATFLICNKIMIYFFKYDFFKRFKSAMKVHSSMADKWDFVTYFNTTFLNISEYFLWLGIPFAILYVLSIYTSIKNLINKNHTKIDQINLTAFILILFLATFGKTVGETARLWIFITPFSILGIFSEIKKEFGHRYKFYSFLIVILQLLNIWFFKKYQDFF